MLDFFFSACFRQCCCLEVDTRHSSFETKPRQRGAVKGFELFFSRLLVVRAMQSVRGWEPRGSDEEKLFIVGDIWVRVWLSSLPLRKYPAGRCQHPSGSKEKEHHHVEDVFRNSSRPYRRRAEGSAFPLVWEQKICSARGKSTTPLLLLLQGRGKSSRGTGREPAVWTARKHAPVRCINWNMNGALNRWLFFLNRFFFLNPEVLCNVWEKNFLKIAQRNGLCKVHFEAEKIQLNTFLQQNTSVSYKPKASRPCAAYNAHRSVVSSSPPSPTLILQKIVVGFCFY